MNGDKTVENGRTIAAISTAQAPGGIGIVRISGSDAKTIASRVFVPAGSHSVMETPGYHALYGTAVSYTHLDVYKRQVLFFPGSLIHSGFICNVIFFCRKITYGNRFQRATPPLSFYPMIFGLSLIHI